MKPFLVERKKLNDLAILLFIDIVLYFIWLNWSVVALFSVGFIWNWVASQDLAPLMENRRYRFSTLRMISNLQKLVVKPLMNMPMWVHSIAKSLPAGVFWSMVIYFNESDMPWWATFIGSLSFEIVQFEVKAFRKNKDQGVV